MNIRMRQTGSILSALCCKYLWMAAFIVIALAAIHSEVIYQEISLQLIIMWQKIILQINIKFQMIV